MRELIHMYLDGVARLRRAMPALGATRRLVGKDTHTLELVAGNFIGDSLQSTGIIGRRYAVGAIRAAIQKRAEMHSCNCAVALDTCLNPHFDGMASTMQQKDLFARAGDLDGPSQATREFAGTDFVRERIGL